MKRRFATFVGVDLGGARGKTTAVAQLAMTSRGHAAVRSISTRHEGAPWVDDNLLGYVEGLGDDVVIAIGAPLTSPACSRCVLPACPGVNECVDPAVVWLRTSGRALTEDAELADTVVAGSTHTALHGHSHPRVRIQPYAHRATELVVCYERGLLPASQIGHATGQVAARAGHLRRRLLRAGFALHQNLLEVSPAATIAALFDRRRARGYKRDADTWQTRAMMIESLADLEFAPVSRLAREDALRNDHCFDALVAAYTAFLWAKDGWTMPEPASPFTDDGWIWVPPPRRHPR
jgi:predicted RNase H-like nuclease